MVDLNRVTLYVGLDVGASVCRIHVADADGRAMLRRSVVHEDLAKTLPAAARKIIGLEYRSCAHGLAFDLVQAGYDVRLIRFRDIPPLGDGAAPAPFACAEALCEAVRTEPARHVPVLAPNQQGRAASQRVKALLKRQRSAIQGAARNLAGTVDAERSPGLGDARGLQHCLGSVAETSVFHQAASALLQVLSVLDDNIASLERLDAPADPDGDGVSRTVDGRDRGGETTCREAEPAYRSPHVPDADRASDMQI